MAAGDLSPFHEAEPIDVFFPAPERQSRLTVLFRPLLALPHAVVLAFIALVGLVLVVGWCAALALGRLPVWIATYEARALEYYGRSYAYALFLDGRFPPFRWRPGGYPVTVRVHQSRVRRWSVLFRAILAIPAEIVASLADAGVGLALPLVWLVVLVRGRLPAVVHYALAGILRYRLRLGGYGSMLTSAYPHELMGDGVVERFPAERDWRLPLTVGSRRLIRLFLVLGVVGFVGNAYLGHRLRTANATLAARSSVVGAYNRLIAASVTFQRAASACAGSASRLRCVQRDEPALVTALERFRADIAAAGLPPRVAEDERATELAADRMAEIVREASTAKSVLAYVGVVRTMGGAGRRLDAATQRLLADLA